MSRYLVFQLYGAMAAWGEPAVGEVRRTNPIPSRSALLGLIAAALGIDRDDEARLQSLQSHYKIAVRVLHLGHWLQDYHTVQMPRENKKLRYATRRDELRLAPEEQQTLLSNREYRCDAYYHIAVMATEGAPYSLESLCAALQQPVFPLYLGRKSCPLGLPLAPQCFDGTLAQVLYCAETQLLTLLKPSVGWGKQCYWEDGMPHVGLTLQQSLSRQDQPLSRQRWQFGWRRQHQGWLDGEE